jgi:hypothetical protein
MVPNSWNGQRTQPLLWHIFQHFYFAALEHNFIDPRLLIKNAEALAAIIARLSLRQ